MANAGKIKAGEAFVKLFTDKKEFDKGVDAARKKLDKFANQTGDAGRKMMIAGGAMSTPLILGLKVFKDYEKQLAMVSTMLDNPEKFMPEYSRRIEDMAMKFGESTEVLTKGLYDILSASIEPAKALDVLTVAVKAAKAGMTDTGVAADAITTMLNAYGLSADKAGMISDWFFSVVKRGKTTFPELAANIGNVASMAASAGVSIDQLGSMLAGMTRAGVKTDVAITSLNAIISTFLNPTEEAKELAKQFGFEMSAAALKSEGLLNIFKKIQSLPPDALAALFPNIRALKGALPALRNVAGLEQDMAIMANKGGASDKAFGKMFNILDTKLNQSKENVFALGNAFGKAFSGEATAFLDFFNDVVKSTKDFISQNEWLVKTVGVTAIGLIAMGSALSGVAIAVKVVSGALSILKLNPVVLTIGAIVAGLYILHRALKDTATYTSQLSDRISERRQQADQQRKIDLDRIERLKQLQKQEKLSSTEHDEARGIIEKLTGKYGNLGISIDKTTGKIVGMKDAQMRLNKAMRNYTIRQLELEIKEKENNKKAWEDKKSSGMDRSGLMSYLRHNAWGGIDGEQAEALKYYTDAAEKQVAIHKEILELKRRIKNLKKAPVKNLHKIGTLTGSGINSTGKPTVKPITIQEAIAARKKLAKLDKSIADEQKTQTERKIDSIKKAHAEQGKLLQTMLDYEKQHGKNVDKMREYENRIFESILTEAARIEKVKRDAIEEINKAWKKQQSDRALGQKYKRQDRIVDKVAGISPILGIKMLDAMFKKAQREAKKAFYDVNKTIKDAEADSIISDDEKEKIDKAKDGYSNKISRMDDIEERLYNAKEAMLDATPKAIGSFSTADLSQQLNHNKTSLSVLKDLLKNTEKIIDEVKVNNGKAAPIFR